MHILLARLVIPWDIELSFLVVGIGASALSAVYFYKIARRYAKHPFRLTLLYSALPWLFFAAHHGLSEPLLMLTLLAGLNYFFERRYAFCTAAFALALLTKELAVLPALAVGLLILYKHGWRKALLFGLALLPFAGFCLIYGLHWGDCLWCVKMQGGASPEGLLGWRTGLYWMVYWLAHGTNSSANRMVAIVYDFANQALNAAVLAGTALGVWLIWRKGQYELAFVNTVTLVPLWFLGSAQYSLNANLGRQFLPVSLVLVACDPWIRNLRGWLCAAYWAALGCMLGIGTLWILIYAKFFLQYKFF